MKVTIKNFQSIEDLTFEIPEKSFTCIVGPSNIGKSAIRRAIGCLLYNNSEASYIRNGTKECSVQVIFDDGLDVKWSRSTSDSGSYVINGVSYSKLNKTVPEYLSKRGFRELFLNKDRVNVQMPTQYEQVFLLNESGSKVTEVFSNLGNLNKIILANKSCSSDLKTNRSKLNVRKEDLVLAKEKIKSYRGLDEQNHSFAQAKEFFVDIKKECARHGQMTDKLKKLDKSLALVRAMKPVEAVEVSALDLDLNKLSTLKALEKKYAVSLQKNGEYLPLKELPDVQFDLGDNFETFYRLKRLSEKLSKSYQVISVYKEVPVVTEEKLFDKEQFDLLKSLLSRLVASKTSVLSLRAEAAESENQVQNLLEEERRLHESLGGVCPLCEGSFSGELNV